MSEDHSSGGQSKDEYIRIWMREWIRTRATLLRITMLPRMPTIVNVDKDEDILEGSYVRHWQEAIRKIWIRADYIYIYEWLEKQYDDAAKVYLEPGAVITGQPGISEFTHHH